MTLFQMLIPVPRNLGSNNPKRNEGFNYIRFIRLPLKKAATVVNGNALSIDWKSLMTEGQTYSYIMGNPPFIGKGLQNEQQKKDMDVVPTGISSADVLDYVKAWYIKAAQHIYGENLQAKANCKNTKVHFVSTNSISQGEQVGVSWN